MEALEAKGILQPIERVGGTSAGAINAALFAAGYTPKQTKTELARLDFNDFKDDSWGVLRDMRRLRDKFGWFKGDYFKEWMGDLLKKKTGSAAITFKALEDHSKIKLYMYSANLSTGFAEVFSPEHTPRTRVADAVRRSMSIPLFFKAIRDDREDVFVDGGLANNYPVKLFDREKYLIDKQLRRVPRYYADENQKLRQMGSISSRYIYNRETLGLRLDSGREIAVFRDGQEPQSEDIDSFLDYTVQLLKAVLSTQESQHLHSDDWQRTIYVDTRGISTFDFDLSEKSKNALVKSGKTAVEKYLGWWDDTSADLAINHPQFQDKPEEKQEPE